LESGPLSGWERFFLLQKFAKYVSKRFWSTGRFRTGENFKGRAEHMGQK
jgi:hypothetical protein